MHKQIATIRSIGLKEEVKPNLYKLTLLVETEERYPQIQPYEIFNDQIKMADGLQPNDRVDISFAIRTSKSVSDAGKVRYFHSLRPSSIAKMPAQLGTDLSTVSNENTPKT